MASPSRIDQFDGLVEALLSAADPTGATTDRELTEMLAIAETLRTLPDPAFRSRLKVELLSAVTLDEHEAMPEFPISKPETRTGRVPVAAGISPTLFASDARGYPVHRSSFVASAFAHTAFLALVVTIGVLATPGTPNPRISSAVVTDISPYILPAAAGRSSGGGGGGDHDKEQASSGNPPRFASEQITPPAIVVRREKPALPTEPTVVGPPSLSFPQTSQVGDPFSRILGTLSNGNGDNGGIGSGRDGGVGPGRGPGVGPGSGGGIGGGAYIVGQGVSAPRAVFDPEPEYSDEARREKYQGIVVLRVVVASDGIPRDIQIARTLGMGLDEKAVEAVRQWRFEPAYKDGRPVAAIVDIEINFRLY
jgi:periplasmic protein TonB